MENKTAKHTPGPWKVTIHHDECGITSYMINEDEMAGSESDDEAEANADLIEAAPELLCALKDAEFLLRKAGQVKGPMQDSFNRSAHDARVALAKAEGDKNP